MGLGTVLEEMFITTIPAMRLTWAIGLEDGAQFSWECCKPVLPPAQIPEALSRWYIFTARSSN
jgi:hypothetical protein